MKKSIVKLLLLLIVGVMCQQAFAQQIPAVPVDADVRIGKLDNGLTYYIRHNEYPKGQADFYIAQKVGSIVEEDNQRGLAHFLEHMCFNGTKSFPGNNLVKWLESVGVKFGANLNAYTSIDQTVYNISSVPTARESVQDSCLLILHDWANDLLLADEEIDAERKVIHEEWRSQMPPVQRILEKVLPDLYPNGNRYGLRLPIGTMEVVDNFPYKALRDYYEKWYRPDLQGIIVVGDIDVDRIEAKIKEMFAGIEMPKDAAERVYFPVEDNTELLYAAGADKEQATSIVEMMFKHPAFPKEQKGTLAYLAYDYVFSMASSMLSNRLSDLAKKVDAPFMNAGAGDGDYLVAKTKAAFNVSGTPKDNDVKKCIEALYREVLRAKRGGFVATEYLRARDEYLSRLETRYKDRDKQRTSYYVNQYVNHFLDNEPIPSLEQEYMIMQNVAKQIPVEMINQAFQEVIKDTNRAVLIAMPEKEGLSVPTKEEIEKLLAAVDAENIEAFVDNVKTEPLIAKLPKAGKVAKKGENKLYEATELTLSNGAKVIYKKTDFKDDEIRFSATAVGGLALVGAEFDNEVRALPYLSSQNGLGTFSHSDLEKYLAGKQANVITDVSTYNRSLSGSTTPKDLKTLMELIYMTMTNYSLNAEEYAATQANLVNMIKAQEVTPNFVFSKNVEEFTANCERGKIISGDVLAAANREKMVEIIKSQFSNAADFTFVFVGNIEEAEFTALVEQYIASLPSNKKTAVKTYKVDESYYVKAGTETKTDKMKMEVPQTYTSVLVTGKSQFSLRSHLLTSYASQILSARFIELVREKEGATYSIRTRGSVDTYDGEVSFSTQFPMKPEKKEVVLKIISDEFNKMTTEIADAEFNKVKEYLVKSYTEGLKVNQSWVSAIMRNEISKQDVLLSASEELEKITKEDVKAFVAEILKQGNCRIYILDPEN